MTVSVRLFHNWKVVLLSLEYKIDHYDKLGEHYANILQENIKEGITEKASEVFEPGNSYYLSHQNFVSENKQSSKWK